MGISTRARIVASAMIAALLAGCGGEEHRAREAAEKAADNAHDVAMVERMSREPFKPILPKEIGAVDMARYGLDRAGCAFRKDGAKDPLFLAGSEEGFMRIAGDLNRYAAKNESAQLPGGAHATYIGLSSWVELVRLPDAGTDSTQDRWPARLVIHDAQERVAFQANGTVDCSPRAESPGA